MSDSIQDVTQLTCPNVVAFMQATGMANDHVETCFRCEEVQAMGGE